MSYIYKHPTEAYEDEVKVIVKTCKRKKLSCFIKWLLIIKTMLTYLYRYVRLLVAPK